MVKNKSMPIAHKSIDPDEVKKRKRRAPGTPYGFLEYVSDFSVKYMNLYPRETSIPNIVRAAAEEWKVMPPTVIADFVEIADENKEYKQVAECIFGRLRREFRRVQILIHFERFIWYITYLWENGMEWICSDNDGCDQQVE